MFGAAQEANVMRVLIFVILFIIRDHKRRKKKKKECKESLTNLRRITKYFELLGVQNLFPFDGPSRRPYANDL